MLLQFTRSRISDLLSIPHAAVVVVSFSHIPSSVSLLARFFVAISLSAGRQRNDFSWIDDSHTFCSLLSASTYRHCHLFPPAGPSPLILHTLEQKCQSRHAPIRFRCTPSLPKSQSLIQLFRSTIVTPRIFHTQSYLSRRHGTSVRCKPPLRTVLQYGNLYLAVATTDYISPITQSRFPDLLKSLVPT